MVVLVIAMTTSCTSMATSNPNTQASVEAAKAFADMKESGTLPGIQKDDHGHLETYSSLWNRKLEYPLERKFKVTKEGEKGTVFWYVLSKADVASPWNLAEAWTINKDGLRKDLIPQEVK